jgi:hypothetical protein
MVSNSYFMNQCPFSTNWLNPKPTAYWDSTLGAPTLVDGAISSQPDVQADGRENRFTYSNDVSQVAWVAVSATKVNATTFTPTAINGQLYQLVNTTSGVTYTLTAEAKVASGTRTLRLFTTYGSGGDAVVGTDWTPLTYTVLANTTAATGWGIGDPAGSGWVSVEVRNLQMRVSTTSSTYVATTTTPIYAAGYPATQGTAANRPILSGASNEENLTLESERLSVTGFPYWTLSNVTVTADAIVAPDGNLTADKVVETAATGVHRAWTGAYPVITGVSYRASVYAKAGERDRFQMRANTGAGEYALIIFDLTNGTVVQTTAGVGTIEAVGDGWYRCTGTGTSAATGNAETYFNLVESGTTINYTGDITKGLYLWGVQSSVAAADTTYVSTTTWRKWRGINGNRVPVFDGSNDSLTTSLAVNPTGGMWGIAVVRSTNAAANGRIFAAFPGTASDRMALSITSAGSIQAYIQNGVTNYIGRTAPNSTITANATTVVSFTYDGGTAASGIKIYKNGVQVDTGDSNGGVYTVPTAGANLTIGSRSAIDGYFNGYLLPAAFGQGGVISETSMNFMVRSLMNRFGIT